MRIPSLLLLFSCPFWIFGQFEIPAPNVDTLQYSITDTVYMSPDGQDQNSGTYEAPVKSFQEALNKLPFGEEGVKGGHAYGLIMLKPGHYHATSGFHQFENNWQRDNVYKNVSIQGIGSVTIGGYRDGFLEDHILILSGDHIFIKNIKLQYSYGIGILLNRQSESRQKHVLIEDVSVDSVGSFSMLLRNVDTIALKRCTSMYASRPGNEDLSSPCQWPSGIKFFNSRECSIQESEIAYTRGEGLNFHNCQRGIAFRNTLHDNGLNFYNDNSSHLSIYQNLIYNDIETDPALWRNCPLDTAPIRSPRGILIANEGACDRGNFPVFDNCNTNCTAPSESFPNVDSVFIFNNILQNVGTGFAFWQGTVDIGGRNCLRNIFIFNNTVIGSFAMANVGKVGLVNVFFPNYNVLFNSFYGYLENVNITHNIFTFDSNEDPTLVPVNMVFHALHPGPKDIEFDHNLWVEETTFMGENGVVRDELPGRVDLLTESTMAIQPCADQSIWNLQGVSPYPFLKEDYLGRPRKANPTNVGALEYFEDCDSVSSIMPSSFYEEFLLYPNPCVNCDVVNFKGPVTNKIKEFQLVSFDGRILKEGVYNEMGVPVREISPGSYVILLKMSERFQAYKLIIL